MRVHWGWMVHTQGERYAGSTGISTTSLSPFPSSSVSWPPASSPCYTKSEDIGSGVRSRWSLRVRYGFLGESDRNAFFTFLIWRFHFGGCRACMVSVFFGFESGVDSCLLPSFEISRLHDFSLWSMGIYGVYVLLRNDFGYTALSKESCSCLQLTISDSISNWSLRYMIPSKCLPFSSCYTFLLF